MNFGERSAQRKRARDLKNEIKQLKKQMLDAGGDKAAVNRLLGEFEAAVLEAGKLSADYEVSSRHIGQAREAITRLLDCMGESPAQEVRQSLKSLAETLDMVYHDCAIRQDDMDFQSTISCFKSMVPGYGSEAGSRNDIMLRSELENIKAVLDDAYSFRAPDFFALAYYHLHGEKDSLKEMENEQRNVFLEDYLKEHFSEEFFAEAEQRGVERQVRELMKAYIEA